MVLLLLACVILHFVTMSTIRNRFLISDVLYMECKNISSALEKSNDLEEIYQSCLAKRDKFFVYIVDSSGTNVYIDTKEQEFVEKQIEPNEKKLLDSIKEFDVQFAHHTVNDNLYIVAAAKVMASNYCTLCFCVV